MGKLLKILPVSDLRQNAANILKKLRDNKEPIIITQRGRAAAVIIGVEAYEKAEHDKEILRLLAKGDKEIEIGEGYEADLILSQEPS
jgi:prevent-host-death family protein